MTVSEEDHGDSMVSSYFNDVTCDNDHSATDVPHANRSLTFDVGYGAVVTCTFTNTHKPLSIHVTKVADPTQVQEPGGDIQYTVTVENTSVADKLKLTVGSFVDQVNRNLAATAQGNTTPDVGSIDCAPSVSQNKVALPVVLTKFGSGATSKVTCTFTLHVTGDATDVINDRVTVTATDNANPGRSVSDYAEAAVTVTDVLPTIQVDKSANPTNIDEPGGLVTFSVDVKNTSVEPVTLKTLVDVPYGDLLDDAARRSDQRLDVRQGHGDRRRCLLLVLLQGAGERQRWHDKTDTVTGTAKDDEGNTATDDGSATVHVNDLLPTIHVDKSANPTHVAEPGGPVTFTVKVKNTSAVDILTLKTLVDVPYGDLLDDAVNDQISGSTCVKDTQIAVNATYECSFQAQVTGNAGQDKT